MSKFVQILRSVSFPLGRVGVGLLLLALTACHTTSQAPLDDAYYWPDKEPVEQKEQKSKQPSETTVITTTTTTTTQSTSVIVTTPSTPIEYTNVQDTTVTIKIKR